MMPCAKWPNNLITSVTLRLACLVPRVDIMNKCKIELGFKDIYFFFFQVCNYLNCVLGIYFWDYNKSNEIMSY